ncbi:acyl-CoA synthetase [Actinomadura algeriensis]|uniref:Acyl-CoA synthetase (AMP-forming)/AMP-acid ligase II n=1 Tax=Actinomadura algeriensis TaxID=1679523 RepID=A0ABR9JJT8_9ACTN|nr:acyl-CoA synthetase [Actinomadura algeriensis]MBE1530817.1 acyl-CoA synthetase (AMP-forming)/AMP-acid ligase II [Actinomadura algeriensis]
MTLQLATLFEAVAAALPDRPALVCGDRRSTYAGLDRRADAQAARLRASGIEPGEHVGIHMLNGVEYVEALLACLKARAVPVNINYRYTDRELHHLYGDAGLAALFVDADFAPAAARVAADCPALRLAIVVGAAEETPWPGHTTAAAYADAPDGAAVPRDDRSADDRVMIYTGGTTGLPKGVVWRHEDFYMAALRGGNHFGEPHRTVESLVAAAVAGDPITYLVTAPLMHGAATYNLLTSLLTGSFTVLMRRFEPLETLRLIDREKALIVMVVGDAIARPLADAIRAHGAAYDLSSFAVLGSGGAILSRSVQAEFAELIPGLHVNNGFGASESGVDGTITVGADGLMRLAPNPRVTVVDAAMTPIPPGSDETGYIARSGHVPLGYHNDPEKTARTFPVIDGARWALLGDMARVEADGTVIVLGRGSGCINTGGEKVFPEEVEQALKSHPAVMDALVAGVPDERFGERVAAVVEARPGTGPSADELCAHLRDHLAGYKIPALITFTGAVMRSPSGKADYRWAKRVLTGQEGSSHA